MLIYFLKKGGRERKLEFVPKYAEDYCLESNIYNTSIKIDLI